MTTRPRIPTTIPHAYRHLLRALLRAVQYSKPARFILRDRLRSSFRSPARIPNPYFPGRSLPATFPASDLPVEQQEAQLAERDAAWAGTGLDERRLARTLELLDGAARVQGPEHRLLRGLVSVWGPREIRKDLWRHREARAVVDARVDGYVEQLGETLGIYVGRV